MQNQQSNVMPLMAQNDLTATSDATEPMKEKLGRRNVGTGERLVSAALGTWLLSYGVKRPLMIQGQLANLGGLLCLYRGVSGHCPVYARLGVDSSSLGQAAQKTLFAPHPYVLHETITIQKPMEDVFAYARDLRNMKAYMPAISEVKIQGDTQTRIGIKHMNEQNLNFDIETIEEIPNNQISWRLTPLARFDLSASLRLKSAPEGRGTEVQVFLRIKPPVGALGTAFFKMSSPINHVLLSQTLHRFKQSIETGEVATIDGQSSGRASKRHLLLDLKESMAAGMRSRSLQSLRAGRGHQAQNGAGESAAPAQARELAFDDALPRGMDQARQEASPMHKNKKAVETQQKGTVSPSAVRDLGTMSPMSSEGSPL